MRCLWVGIHYPFSKWFTVNLCVLKCVELDPTPCATPGPPRVGAVNTTSNIPQSTPYRQRLIPQGSQQQFSHEQQNENYFMFQNPNSVMGMNNRQPLGGLSENSLGSRFVGGHVGGLSAGVRVGRPYVRQQHSGVGVGGVMAGRGVAGK